MDYETLKLTLDGPAAIICLNRPSKRNAITFRMMEELECAFAALYDQGNVRGIIVTGAEACFSTGMDLNALKDVISPAQFMSFMEKWRRLNEALENHSKPIIAAIEGYCLTGGFELALACDLRVGARGSQYGITSSKIGTVPGAGGTQRLPRIVGMANALDILFSGDPMDAERAYQLGVINRLTEQGQALSTAKEMVGVYANRGPLSLQWAKRAVYAGMQMSLAEGIKYEAFVVSTIYQTADKQEGIRSFLEKRSPRFTGA
ncbi:MAG: enoyl-CoA hydratase/isomerase family protein [Burkholderiales bacterium]|nr:enoyl-CoA hydratase/isomerase family protein [Burkholderiales bacterium]